MQAIQLIDATQISRDEWLESRRKGIGGSDCGAILGFNPYKSAFGVYVEKVEGSTFEGNIHTEFGNWMEPHIREEFPKRFKRKEKIDIHVSECPFVLQHPEVDYFIANLDGIVEHPEHGTGIIEIKTASELQWRQWEDDEIPDSYYAQIQHYLNVTGLPYAYMVALVGKRLLWKYVPRNDEFIKLMSERLREFWEKHVIPKVPPAPAGIQEDFEVLKGMYPEEERDKILELPEFQGDYDRYKEIDKQIKELQQEQNAIKQRIMQEMGDAELAFIGNKKVTWKTVNRKGYTVGPKTFRMFRIY